VALVIRIDRETCMGSGSCAFHAPATFDLDDALKAVVVDATGDPDDAIRLAADGCPTRSITLDEAAPR
jgi:ferredoxin